MLRNKKNLKISVLGISLLSLLLIGMFSTVAVAVTYDLGLTKGTEISEVMPYDEKEWGKIVKDWFLGNGSKSGAKSKTTTLAYYQTSWDLYYTFTRFILFTLFDPKDVYSVIGLIYAAGYDQEKINSTYTKEYPLWSALQAKWYFTNQDFNETANSTFSFLPIFQDPTHYKHILDDYNRLAKDLNNEAFLRYLGVSFPILTADEFLWKLVLHGLTLASPVDTYLKTLVQALGCSGNIGTNGNILTFTRPGAHYYTVEVNFDALGTQNSFVVKNIYGTIVYQINTTHSSTLVYVILGIIAICMAGIALYYYYVKRRKSLKIKS